MRTKDDSDCVLPKRDRLYICGENVESFFFSLCILKLNVMLHLYTMYIHITNTVLGHDFK